MRTPDIGRVVLRLDSTGEWVEDWVCMVRICHGNQCRDDEVGVLWWGAGKFRHRPGDDRWKLRSADCAA